MPKLLPSAVRLLLQGNVFCAEMHSVEAAHQRQMAPQTGRRAPAAPWLKKLRMTMGMPNLRAGMVVRGCSTLAPK